MWLPWQVLLCVWLWWRESLHTSLVAHLGETYLRFLLHQGSDYSSIKFAGTQLYTKVERGTVRVKCLAQEHNTGFLARVQTPTARSRGEHTNHKATAPRMRAWFLRFGIKTVTRQVTCQDELSSAQSWATTKRWTWLRWVMNSSTRVKGGIWRIMLLHDYTHFISTSYVL